MRYGFRVELKKFVNVEKNVRSINYPVIAIVEIKIPTFLLT